jgi:hypothetical protein
MMTRFVVFVSMTAVLLGGTVDAAETMAIADVVPGAKGVCLTELDGGEMAEIPLTVLGALSPSAPERELILVRLDDPRFSKIGIVAGMSGSPVYVDGRLVGALAFGWSFSAEPVAGVTPFERMLELGGETARVAEAAAARPRLEELVEARRRGTLGERLLEWLVPAQTGSLQRLPLAVSFGGRQPPEGDGWMAESWRRLGWVGAPAAVATTSKPIDEPMRPGSMVAAVLVEGDAVVAAGGTVTEIRGDAVWAFGHPYLGTGGVRLPMARARTVAVLPSIASSFKFFEVGEIVGAIESDRTHGVWGRMGGAVPMVPIEVDVDDRSYSFRAVRHDILLPLMASFVADSSVAARGRVFGNTSVSMGIEIDYEGDRMAVYTDSFASGSASAEAAGMAGAVLAYLESSPFEVPEVEAVRIRLETSEGLDTATIVDAIPERSVVHPGMELPVRLRLRPHRGADYERLVTVRVPDEVPEGRIDLVVADGGAWNAYDLQMRPFLPASFDDEIRYISRLISSRRIVLALERRQSGVAFSGGALAVPPSLVVQLRSALGPYLKTTDYGVWSLIEEEMPTSVVGAQRIQLTVRLPHWED